MADYQAGRQNAAPATTQVASPGDLLALLNNQTITENWPDDYMAHPLFTGKTFDVQRDPAREVREETLSAVTDTLRGVAMVEVDGQLYSAWRTRSEIGGPFDGIELRTMEEVNKAYYNLPGEVKTDTGQTEEKLQWTHKDTGKTFEVHEGLTEVHYHHKLGVHDEYPIIDPKTFKGKPEEIGTTYMDKAYIKDGVVPHALLENVKHLQESGYEVKPHEHPVVTSDREAKIAAGAVLREANESARISEGMIRAGRAGFAPVLTATRAEIEQNPQIGFAPAPVKDQPAATEVAMPDADFRQMIAAYAAAPKEGGSPSGRKEAEKAYKEIDAVFRGQKDNLPNIDTDGQARITAALEKCPDGYKPVLAQFVQKIQENGAWDNGIYREGRHEIKALAREFAQADKPAPNVTGTTQVFNEKSGAAEQIIVKPAEITEKDLSAFKPTGELLDDFNRAQDVLKAIAFQHMTPKDLENALPPGQVAELVTAYRTAGYNDFADVMEKMQEQTHTGNYAEKHTDASDEMLAAYQKRYIELAEQQDRETDYPSDPVKEKERAETEEALRERGRPDDPGLRRGG